MTTWGMHIHHDTLFEPLAAPIEERIAFIREHKLAGEVSTRLRVMRVLTGAEAARLPVAFTEAYAAFYKAHDDHIFARVGYAADRCYAAREELGKAHARLLPELEALHRELCVADCPWNGQTLFPEEIA